MTSIFSYSLNCVYEIVVYGFTVKDMCAHCRQTDRQTERDCCRARCPGSTLSLPYAARAFWVHHSQAACQCVTARPSSIDAQKHDYERESVKVQECVCVATHSCPTLCDPTDWGPPGSSVPGILQARILRRVAISSFRGSSQSKNQTHISCIGRWVL